MRLVQGWQIAAVAWTCGIAVAAAADGTAGHSRVIGGSSGTPIHTTTTTTTTSTSTSTITYGTITGPRSSTLNYVCMQNANSIAVADALAVPGLAPLARTGVTQIGAGPGTTSIQNNYTQYNSNVAFSDGTLANAAGTCSAVEVLAAAGPGHPALASTTPGSVTASAAGSMQVITLLYTTTDSNIVVGDVIIGTNTNINTDTNTDTASFQAVNFTVVPAQPAAAPAPAALLLAISGALALGAYHGRRRRPACPRAGL